MTTTYGTEATDANTQTIAAAWASSALGQPEREVRYGFAPTGPIPVDDEPPTAKRVMIAAGLASGIAASALLGVVMFYNDTSQPAIVAPGPSPQHAVIVGPSSAAPALAPKPVVSVEQSAPVRVAPAPQAAPTPQNAPSAAPVATPPVPTSGDTSVVVDIPLPDYPPLPPKPEDPDPEPPKPPVPDDLDFKAPEPPKPDPKPDPPEFLPDLPLAPLPKPDPVIKLPLAPSPKLNPQPEPPSMPNFVLPDGLGT
jgi:hypothetical protein